MWCHWLYPQLLVQSPQIFCLVLPSHCLSNLCPWRKICLIERHRILTWTHYKRIFKDGNLSIRMQRKKFKLLIFFSQSKFPLWRFIPVLILTAEGEDWIIWLRFNVLKTSRHHFLSRSHSDDNSDSHIHTEKLKQKENYNKTFNDFTVRSQNFWKIETKLHWKV